VAAHGQHHRTMPCKRRPEGELIALGQHFCLDFCIALRRAPAMIRSFDEMQNKHGPLRKRS
jgi:hypothetical protein